MIEVPIYKKGRVVTAAAISDRDADLTADRWTLNVKGYARRRTPRTEYMHRVIGARMLGRGLDREQVHHGLGGILDNRRENLTVCADHLEHKAQHYEHPGLRWDQDRGLWIVRPTIRGRQVFLGRFDNFERALEVWKGAQ